MLINMQGNTPMSCVTIRPAFKILGSWKIFFPGVVLATPVFFFSAEGCLFLCPSFLSPLIMLQDVPLAHLDVGLRGV